MGAIFVWVLTVVVCLAIGFLMRGVTQVWTVATKSEANAIVVTGSVAGIIALLTAVVAIWGVYSQRVIARRQATIEHFARLDGDSVVQETIQKFITLSGTDENLAKWADKAHIGSSEALAITAVLNDYELISIGIQEGI